MTLTNWEEHGPPIPVRLSRDARKRALYAADTFFQESFEQLAGLTADPAGFAFRHGLLLLKPDAVVARGLTPTLDWLRRNGFEVAAARRVRLNPTMVRSLWYFQWNLATVHRRRIADLFTATADSLLLVVREPGAASVDVSLPVSLRLTDLKGPTDPAAREPGQLRHELGRFSFLLNQVHTTDEPADVIRELGIYVDAATREALVRRVLSGVDADGEARELVDGLYAEVPAQDLEFGPAAKRLLADAERLSADPALPAETRLELAAALAYPGDDGLRRVVDAFWRTGLELSTWDVTVVASSVFPMKTRGFRPILDTTTPADWQVAA